MSCTGETVLSPEKFMALNKELSYSAVIHIGKHHFKNDRDGRHLIWTDLAEQEHDLGTVKDTNIFHEYPGFHKLRTHALGNQDVAETQVIELASQKKQVTVVKMKDGTSGVGPNYRIALRNAALKVHLKKEFQKASGWRFWERLWMWHRA